MLLVERTKNVTCCDLNQLFGNKNDAVVSSDSSKETIMKAIQHGACDYLIKPIQKKEVEIIWKHVVRRKNIILPDPESSGSLEKNNNEILLGKNDDINGDAEQSRKKRREPPGEDDGELENGEESKKKERFNWNGERHKQFVAAVNQLGVNSKTILNYKFLYEIRFLYSF